jgi:hypothetical protein
MDRIEQYRIAVLRRILKDRIEQCRTLGQAVPRVEYKKQCNMIGLCSKRYYYLVTTVKFVTF